MIRYMETLQRLQNLDARVIAPGHGPLITNPAAKIREYLRHREEREAQILEALRDGPATIQELVEGLYRDVDTRLHGLAAGSVQAQLDKLEIEGQVRRIDEKFAAIDQ
jgi:glyoxylase-like metal-dependent hydrolase (beta-lactamase superfamily II)